VIPTAEACSNGSSAPDGRSEVVAVENCERAVDAAERRDDGVGPAVDRDRHLPRAGRDGCIGHACDGRPPGERRHRLGPRVREGAHTRVVADGRNDGVHTLARSRRDYITMTGLLGSGG